jgi:hypothetical protein
MASAPRKLFRGTWSSRRSAARAVSYGDGDDMILDFTSSIKVAEERGILEMVGKKLRLRIDRFLRKLVNGKRGNVLADISCQTPRY